MQLRNEPIHIPSIRIDQPKLVIEQSGGKLNFKALMDQMSGFPAECGGGIGRASSAAGRAGGGGRSRRGGGGAIERLQDGDAHHRRSNHGRCKRRRFVPAFPAWPTRSTVPIPTFDLKNIGNADGNGERRSDQRCRCNAHQDAGHPGCRIGQGSVAGQASAEQQSHYRQC
jgi:hypothetical protein